MILIITEISKENHASRVLKIVNHASHCYAQSRLTRLIWARSRITLIIWVSHHASRKTPGADLGGGCAPPPPHHPEITCGFLIQLVFCQKKKKTKWFIGVEVEQEKSAPPPKKNPGSAPEPLCHPDRTRLMGTIPESYKILRYVLLCTV